MTHCSLTCNWGRRFENSQIEEAVNQNKLLTLDLELNTLKPHGTAARLDFTEWKDVVDQGLELGVRRIILNGRGEPLKNDRALDLIQYIRPLGCEVDLFTSGSLVTEEIAQRLFELGIHVVVKTEALDSGIPADLKNLLEAGYPEEKCLLGINIVITRENINNIPELWLWARQNSIVPFVRRSVSTPIEKSKNKKSPEISIAELLDLFNNLAQIDREKFKHQWTPHPPLAGQECDCLQYSLSITSTGLVRPCIDMDLSLGDIRQTSLEKIIRESPELNQLRKAASNIKGYCKKCGKKEGCYGCRAAALFFTHDFLESDPYCWNRRLINDDHKDADLSDKLPHKEEMKLISGMAYVERWNIKMPVTVPAEGIFVSPDGKLSPLALIEMLAQLCAVQQLHENQSNHKQNIFGYLVGMENINFLESIFSGENLDLTAWKTFEIDEINKIHGEVFRGTAEISQVDLTLYEAEGWQPMPKISEPRKNIKGVITHEIYPWMKNKDRVAQEVLQSVIKLEDKSRGYIEATFCFPSNFICFPGHFPEYPVLPAVVIVYAGWLLAELGQLTELSLAKIRKGKFLRPIHPFDFVNFCLKAQEEKNDELIWYTAQVKCKNGLVAKYDLGFSPGGRLK